MTVSKKRQKEFEKHVAHLRVMLGTWLIDAEGMRMAALLHVTAEMLAAFHTDVIEAKRAEVADEAFAGMRDTHDHALKDFDRTFAMMESQGQSKH